MFPAHAPFSPEQRHSLTQLLAGLNPTQTAWLSGYLAASSPAPAGVVAPAAGPELTVLYGTESGNAEDLAAQTVKLAKKQGFKAKLVNMADIEPAVLSKCKKLLVIVSTWGEGDAPESAVAFHKEFMNEELSLEGVEFSVCGLGDTSYEQFCKIGKDFDARLEQLGAQRVTDRVDCDVDFEETYEAWVADALAALTSENQAAAAGSPVFESVATAVFDKKNPFHATVLSNFSLSGVGSAKETIHVELDLEGSGLSYEAGDALAVLAINAADVVDDVLDAVGMDGQVMVTPSGTAETSLIDALTHKLDITALSRAMAQKWAMVVKNHDLDTLLDHDHQEEFRNFAQGRQIVDLLRAFPAKELSPQLFVDCLRKLPPRLYSIASSPAVHQGEVHLTVAAVRYHSYEKQRKGVASTFLADFGHVGEKVQVYVHKNNNFRLPPDPATPLIMVGPGTGIAPFRAFIAERAANESRGESWLFFGDQKYSYDFLYQLEWQEHLKDGALTRIDLAFSRDQPEKVYVQDRIREKGAELFTWLERGAHLYVCGDANRMAHDVHEALLDVLEVHGSRAREDATAYLEAMKKAKRYQRDVY